MKTPKRKRAQLARSELLVLLAVKAQEWADDCGDLNDDTIPFEKWPDDESFVAIAKRYGLTGRDLCRLLSRIAQETEDRAVRAGYERAWVGGD